MQVLVITLAFSYAALVLCKRNAAWFIFAFVFLLISVLLRMEIEIDSLKDFAAYYRSFQEVKYEGAPIEFLVEPYRLALFKTVLYFFNLDDFSQITFIYQLHFFIVTAFFMWLAWLRDVSFEAKLILFLAFYPPIAFVWLRAGMAYVAAGYLFYTITKGKARLLHFLVPAVHASSLLFLGAIKTRDFKLWQKVLVVVVIALSMNFIIESPLFRYIIAKLERYSDTADQRTSSGLLFFHIANILLFVYLALINANFRKNFVILTLMVGYLAMYYINPVTGLRVFPFVLIAVVTERITFPRFQMLSLLVAGGYVPIYLARFDQIFL
jgi:hypothetical protein